MSKRPVFELKVFSRCPLDDTLAAKQIKTLVEFGGGIFTPEKCDVYEPLREKFDPDNIEAPVRWLTYPGADFKFKRSRPIWIEGYIHNAKFAQTWIREGRNKPRVELKPTVPEPIFSTLWTAWIDMIALQKKGVEFLKEFVLATFHAAAGDYAFLTPEVDYIHKNFLVTEDDQGTTEQFVGDNPAKGLPGLYWMNVFGPLYVEWFGLHGLKEVPATVVEPHPDGALFLQFGESPDLCESAEVLEQQLRAREILGDSAFFDIARPNRSLATPFANRSPLLGK